MQAFDLHPALCLLGLQDLFYHLSADTTTPKFGKKENPFLPMT
jgi:hypothetical protein